MVDHGTVQDLEEGGIVEQAVVYESNDLFRLIIIHEYDVVVRANLELQLALVEQVGWIWLSIVVARVSKWVVGHILCPQVEDLLGLSNKEVLGRVSDLEAVEADDTKSLWLRHCTGSQVCMSEYLLVVWLVSNLVAEGYQEDSTRWDCRKDKYLL